MSGEKMEAVLRIGHASRLYRVDNKKGGENVFYTLYPEEGFFTQ